MPCQVAGQSPGCIIAVADLRNTTAILALCLLQICWRFRVSASFLVEHMLFSHNPLKLALQPYEHPLRRLTRQILKPPFLASNILPLPFLAWKALRAAKPALIAPTSSASWPSAWRSLASGKRRLDGLSPSAHPSSPTPSLTPVFLARNSDSSSHLQKEANVELETAASIAFRALVRDGQWQEVSKPCSLATMSLLTR